MGLLRETSTRDKQAVVLYAALAVLFVFLYLVFFPRALPPEFTLVPQEATSLTETKTERLTAGGSFFLLGDREGYWDANGHLEKSIARRPQVTVSGDKAAWYDASQSQVVVESASGPLFSVAGEMYPLWLQGRLFTFDENRLGLTALGPQGQVLWKKHFASLITALDTTAQLTVVGTLDGRVQVFAADGTPAGGFQPGGSRLPVIYNASLAPNNGTILVLAGVDPKRFLVLERGGSEFRPVFHKPLRENSPWPTPLGFLNQGTLAFYQNESGLVLLDPRSPDREIVIPASGGTQGLESLPGGSLLAFVQGGPPQALRIAAPSGESILTLPLKAQDLLLRRQGNSLLLGIDDTLLRFEVRVQ